MSTVERPRRREVSGVGHGDAAFGAGVGGQFFLPLGHFGTQDVSTVVELALDASVNVGLEALILGFEVNEFHGIFRFQSVCQCWGLAPMTMSELSLASKVTKRHWCLTASPSR